MNKISQLAGASQISGATPRNSANGNESNDSNGYWIFIGGMVIAGMTLLYITRKNQPFDYDKGK